MDNQEHLQNNRVGKGERHADELEGPVVLLHRGTHLLKGSRQQRRRDTQDPTFHTVHNFVLQPLKHDLGLVLALRQFEQVIPVDAGNINELAPHGPLVLHVRVFELAVDHGIQEADKAHDFLLKCDDQLVVSLRVPAEGEQRADDIKPIAERFEGQIRPLPKTGICLRGAEYTDETDDRCEGPVGIIGEKLSNVEGVHRHIEALQRCRDAR
eukprot:CAMPEP_0194491886 /NCGR_PEP_ID=MMETSP0253-20130528/10634_1 /TAXON_ID=2966 /ORGANISM="Noctiluca scintillans" /LENGTH=210 /DNA_ID=CAMNT_0039332681 /DNA_START=196 /DNA_END=828 /DNA_ORIENTATION=-